MVSPLTQAAMQKIAAMLMQQPQQSQGQPYDYSPQKGVPGMGSQLRSAMQLQDAVPPAPQQGPVPSFSPPMGAGGSAPAVSPEGMVNQTPPMPNPPLAAPPPPVNNASFSPMGATGAPPGPPMLGAGPGTSPMGATPAPTTLQTGTEPVPVIGDETVRQAILKAMRMGNNPAATMRSPWAQNFGNLADQAG